MMTAAAEKGCEGWGWEVGNHVMHLNYFLAFPLVESHLTILIIFSLSLIDQEAIEEETKDDEVGDSDSVNSEEFYDAKEEAHSPIATIPSVKIPVAEGDPSGRCLNSSVYMISFSLL